MTLYPETLDLSGSVHTTDCSLCGAVRDGAGVYASFSRRQGGGPSGGA